MSMQELQNLEGVETGEKDTLGGGGFIAESGVHLCDIIMAYKTRSGGGAYGIAFELKTENGVTVRKTVWYTNKEGKPYSERDGKKTALPGYNMLNSMFQMVTDKEFPVQETATKTIKIWDFDAGADVNTEVEAFVDIIGKKIYVGIHKEVVDKNVNVGTKEKPDWQPSGETREQNEIKRFFHYPTGLTSTEAKAGEKEGKFINEWREKWTGQTLNKAKGGANTGSEGAPQAASASGEPKSLFGG